MATEAKNSNSNIYTSAYNPNQDLIVYDNKTGKRVEGVTQDNLSQYWNSNYTFDENSMIPVVDAASGSTGLINARSYDPSKYQVQTSDWQPDEVKYGKPSDAVEVFGRNVANAATLGAYGLVADRFKTPEERLESKKRQEANPVAGFIGETVPYLIPVLGEGLIARSAIAKTVVAPLDLGRIAVTRAGLKGVVGGIVGAAVDGAAQSFTTGVSEASLDDNLSSEVVSRLMMQTAIGAGIGGAIGGTVSGVLTKLGSKAEAGAVVEEATKPAKGISESETTKLMNRFMDGKAFKGQTKNITPQTQANLGKFAKQFNDDFTNLSSSGTTPSPDLAERLSIYAAFGENPALFNKALEHRDYDEYVNTLLEHRRIVDSYTTGADPLDTTTTKLKDLILETLSTDEASVSKSIKQFSINSAEQDIQAVATNTVRSDIENQVINLFDLNLDENSVFKHGIPNGLPDGASKGSIEVWQEVLGSGDNSVSTKAFRAIDQETNPEAIRNSMGKRFMGGSNKEDLDRLVNNHLSQYNPSLTEKLKGAVRSDKLLEAQYGRLTEQELTSTSRILWRTEALAYLEDTQNKIDRAWAEYKESLPLGTKPTKAETQLFSTVKGLYADYTGSVPAFGYEASRRAANKEVRRRLIEAERNLKKTVGWNKQKDEPNFAKMIDKMLSNKPSARREATQAFDEYLDAYESLKSRVGIPEAISLDPDNMPVATNIKDLLKKRINEYRVMKDKEIQKDWKSIDEVKAKLATGEEKGQHGGTASVSTATRVAWGLHDLAGGNFGRAFYEGQMIVADTVIPSLSKLWSTITKRVDAQNIIKSRIRAYNEIKGTTQELKERVSSVAGSLVSNKSKITKPLASLSIGAINNSSYMSMAISGKKESKEEIKQRYEKVSAYLNSTVSHPEAFIGRYEKMSEGLDDINKNLYNGIAGNIVALNSKMISVRPISGNANYTKGGRNLTTTQMAHYLDSVDAMINPHKILGMIEARTISPEMLALFKQFNPEIWNALRSEVGAKIQQQAASGEASQVSPVVGSYFGIPVAPQMNPYSSLYKPETQPQAQGQAQGQPQQAQPLSRPSGVDKFINKDFYNRDLNLNK